MVPKLYNPVVFLINPFELTYLHDMSLANILFSGSLYLDGEKSNIASILSFNSTNNLQTLIQSDSLDLYKGNVNLNGELFLSEKGLFVDVFDNVVDMDNAVKELAKKLTTYNPKAMKELKKIMWEGTEDWDVLLAQRAANSGKLVLSDFTQNAILEFKQAK